MLEDDNEDITYLGSWLPSSSSLAPNAGRERSKSVEEVTMTRTDSPQRPGVGDINAVTLHLIPATPSTALGPYESRTYAFLKSKTSTVIVGRNPAQSSSAVIINNDGKTNKEGERVGSLLFRCPVISKRHAKITFQGDGLVYITDLSSHHGTHLLRPSQGQLVSTPILPAVPTRLFANDVLTFGKTVGRSGGEANLVRPITVRVQLTQGNEEARPETGYDRVGRTVRGEGAGLGLSAATRVRRVGGPDSYPPFPDLPPPPNQDPYRGPSPVRRSSSGRYGLFAPPLYARDTSSSSSSDSESEGESEEGEEDVDVDEEVESNGNGGEDGEDGDGDGSSDWAESPVKIGARQVSRVPSLPDLDVPDLDFGFNFEAGLDDGGRTSQNLSHGQSRSQSQVRDCNETEVNELPKLRTLVEAGAGGNASASFNLPGFGLNITLPSVVRRLLGEVGPAPASTDNVTVDAAPADANLDNACLSRAGSENGMDNFDALYEEREVGGAAEEGNKQEEVGGADELNMDVEEDSLYEPHPRERGDAPAQPSLSQSWDQGQNQSQSRNFSPARFSPAPSARFSSPPIFSPLVTPPPDFMDYLAREGRTIESIFQSVENRPSGQRETRWDAEEAGEKGAEQEVAEGPKEVAENEDVVPDVEGEEVSASKHECASVKDTLSALEAAIPRVTKQLEGLSVVYDAHARRLEHLEQQRVEDERKGVEEEGRLDVLRGEVKELEGVKDELGRLAGEMAGLKRAVEVEKEGRERERTENAARATTLVQLTAEIQSIKTSLAALSTTTPTSASSANNQASSPLKRKRTTEAVDDEDVEAEARTRPRPRHERRLAGTIGTTAMAVTVGAVGAWSALAFS